MKLPAAQLYCQNTVTLTEAAHRAGLTLLDFQHYLVDKGFVSSYSLEDLSEELQLLSKIK